MNNIRTIDPEMVSVNLFFKKDFYQKASNYLDIISSYQKELDLAIDWHKTSVQNDVITNQINFFDGAKSKFKQMPTDFVVYWLEIFYTSITEVQNQIKLQASPTSYYGKLSDCVNFLSRPQNYATLATESITMDKDVTKLPVPILYGAILENKVSPNAKLVTTSLSKATNALFRYCMFNIQEKVAESTKPHGENYVPDFKHYERMQKSIILFTQVVRSVYQDFYRILEYYSNYNPTDPECNVQVIPPTVITTMVEGQPQYQTLLRARAADIMTAFTNQRALDVRPIS